MADCYKKSFKTRQDNIELTVNPFNRTKFFVRAYPTVWTSFECQRKHKNYNGSISRPEFLTITILNNLFFSVVGAVPEGRANQRQN
jgi:hypothetical protein